MNTKPHNLLFLFGFFYYLVLPPIVGSFGLMMDMPLMDKWHSDFAMAKIQLDKYFFIIMSYFLFFYLGSFSISLLKNKSNNFDKNIKYKEVSLSSVAIAFLFLIFIIAYLHKEILFTGYQSYEGSILATLASLSTTSLILFLYAQNNFDKKIFLFNIVLSSILLLGLGSRMYVLIPIVALFVYKMYYSYNKWKFKSILLFGFFMLLVFLVIGAWRIGANISSDFLLYLFLAEPTFTWWSSATFLGNNVLQIIDTPLNFFSSFINFIPSILFPEKGSLIFSLKDAHYYEAPLGADSIFVSIQGNFGWYFGIFYMFFLGLFYSIIETFSGKNKFFFAYYIGIVSLLPFQFFRDNFAIINKQMFWNMLILPLAIIFIVFLLCKLLPKKRNIIANNLR